MIRRWHAIPQLRLPIPFPDIVEKLFLATVLMICFQSVLGKHVKLFFLSLEKVARRENKEAFSVPAGIRVIRVVLVLPYKKKKEVRIRVVAFTPFEMYDISVSES